MRQNAAKMTCSSAYIDEDMSYSMSHNATFSYIFDQSADARIFPPVLSAPVTFVTSVVFPYAKNSKSRKTLHHNTLCLLTLPYGAPFLIYVSDY